MPNLTAENVATKVAKQFYDRWDRQTASGYETECFGRVDVVESVYDQFDGDLSDKDLERAVDIAYRILRMPEREARKAIQEGVK